MKKATLILVFILSVSCIYAQKDKRYPFWVNTSIGWKTETAGASFSLDFEFQDLWKPGRTIIGITTSSYSMPKDDESASLITGIKFAHYLTLIKPIELYAGTIQGADFIVKGNGTIEGDYYFDNNFSWNRWSSTIFAGVCLKVSNTLSIFSEIYMGSPYVKYTFGVGVRIWD